MRVVKVTNLPSRSQNPNLKENLYDEFVKHGRIIAIRIDGEGEKKICYILFKRSEQAQDACEKLNERLFLQQTVLKCERIDLNLFISTLSSSSSSSSNANRMESSAPPAQLASASSELASQLMSNLSLEEDIDEYCQKATRTLYIGNLDRDVKYSDLREKLDKKYGDIIEIEIKKDNKKPPQQSSSGGGGSSSSNSYAFIQFSDIKSVIKAMRCMYGKCIGNNLIKLGFGKIKPTKTLWLDGVSEKLTDAQLMDYFKNYCENNVEQILIDRQKCQALVYFGYIEDAKTCAEKIRAKNFNGKRIMVDFASKEFISSRFEHLLDPKHHLFANHNRQAQASAEQLKDRKLSSRNNHPLYSSSRQRSPNRLG
jgi:RNA recognition motif-containing protein